jgi:Peptidase M15
MRPTFLADAAKYFDGLQYQADALDWLQAQIPPEILEQFAAKFSPAAPPPSGGAAKEAIKKDFDPTKIDWHETNCPISKFFTVGEVTKGDEDRIPERGSDQEKNILALAQELDKLRIAFGHPIGVSSWYRPPAVNRAVGGARYSQHISGRGVDIYPLSGMDIDDFQDWCDKRWFGALGYGASKGFVHLDTRNGKGFDAGGDKGVRWNY